MCPLYILPEMARKDDGQPMHEPTEHPGTAQFLGCLIGLAIGDALGAPVDGLSREEIAVQYGWVDHYLARPATATTPALPPGRFTDQTELALCVVEGIVSGRGFLDPAAIGYRFLRVLDGEAGAFVDATTRQALARAAETDQFQQGLADVEPPSAAPLSRVIPIGLLHALAPFNVELFTRDVMRVLGMTHSDLTTLNAALAVAYAVRSLAAGEVPPELLLEDVLHFIDEDLVAANIRQAAALAATGGDIERDLAHLVQLGHGPAAHEAVAAAFYSFAVASNDARRALTLAVNAGGATRIIGALTGALVGTVVGADGLPETWRAELDGVVYLQMAAAGLLRAAEQRAGILGRLRMR